MEMVFSGKTMNFVNATHVNGESESNGSTNDVCWSQIFTDCTKLRFCLCSHADEAPALSSPKLACRWKYR